MSEIIHDISIGSVKSKKKEKEKILILRQVFFLTHLSRRVKGELLVYPCSGVLRHRRCRSPFSNINISDASRAIAIKFYLKHHLGRGKAEWGFGADQYRTLVSMATDSSHRVIMGKWRHHVFSNVFGSDPFHTYRY